MAVVDAWDERSDAMGKVTVSLEEIKSAGRAGHFTPMTLTLMTVPVERARAAAARSASPVRGGSPAAKGFNNKPRERPSRDWEVPQEIGTVDVEFMYSGQEGEPDFHFLDQFTTDNTDLKPRCNNGCEGWVWMKGAHDHSFQQHWMWVTDTPKPSICYLDQVHQHDTMVLI
jgi:hypothetical protein